ncbi:MAG: hypothetical protein ACPG4Z_07195 [Chitinophagales bacterium]
MSKKFEFTSELKKPLFIMLALGIVAALLTFFFYEENHQARFWSNILLNTYYFGGIALTGLFFVAAHQLGYGGWQTVFKKIPLAMGRFLYVALGLAAIITIGLVFDIHHLYGHWSVHVDAIVATKWPFLNNITYTVLVLGFFGSWAAMAFIMNKAYVSIKNYKEYQNSKYIAALFIVLLGVGSSVLSWIFIMSLDPHWYSTLFGWYNFASYACAGFSMMILIILGLKSMGYLPNVNENHIHDLGKYLFGFSVFWTYLWFSQFMLIWYANIPEATIWFEKRFDEPLFKFIFFAGFLINFIVPILALMKRESKRQIWTIGTICVVVIFGHYLDFYQMVMLEPMAIVEHHDDHHDEAHAEEEHHSAIESGETVLYAETEAHSDSEVHADDHHDEAHADDTHAEDGHGDDHHGEEATTYAAIGLPELFIFGGFLASFLLMTFSGLNGKELEMKEDPYLKESIKHHI